ncbi:MAG: tyrosine-type recombinase/integrase [Ruminococcus sp.]|nr:tyrosine-type recombinase/integrase [Ruminococcus sp.]MBR4628789.1 tyrosine-type recombinase/integrase [Ruminococcus sp.]
MTEIMSVNTGIATTTQVIGADLLSRFIAYLDAAPKTVETYTRQLRQLFKFFAENGITQPTRDDLIAYKEALRESGHKPTTIQGYIIAARQFFTWTEVEGIYPNIAEHLKGARIDREHKKDYLTAAQVKAILETIERDTLTGLRDYAMLVLMVTCGLRTIEIARANIGDLRTAAGQTVLYIQGKGHEEKADYVKVTAQVEKAIRAYLKARGKAADSEPLFTSTSNNSRGKALTTRSISGIVKTRMQNAGYDSERLTAHSLRHTAVTLALLAGEDITEVQQFARHANIATTQIYNHALDKAANGCASAIADAIF